MSQPQIRQLLWQIAVELKKLQLWGENAPSIQALASTAPFCCDTMPFEQWLQFILLPRLEALLDGALPLPTQSSICPMAEQAFAALGNSAWPLINRLGDLDELLSGKREQQIARD